MILGVYLAGTNTWRGRPRPAAANGPLSKDAVSRLRLREDRHVAVATWPTRIVFVSQGADRPRARVPVLVTLGVRANGQRVVLDLRLAGEECRELGRGRRQPCGPAPDSTGVGHDRRESRARHGAPGALARLGDSAMHRAQTAEPAIEGARAAPRGTDRRLPPHDLRRNGDGRTTMFMPRKVGSLLNRTASIHRRTKLRALVGYQDMEGMKQAA